ncbi:MAG: dihydroorotase [Bacteroidia bacterium]|nr:dihydroorotase [Bacteroidia bacterium]
MSTVLLKNITVTDPNSSYNNKVIDLLIKDGIITDAGSGLKAVDAEVHDFKGCYASTGWLDLRAQAPDPGYEFKEDLQSLQNVAASGGFTAVCVLPSGKPVTQGRSAIEYIINKGRQGAVELLPLGAITQNLTEENITEMYDMKVSGAVAFSNANHPVSNAGVMSRAMLYATNFNGLIYSLPHDEAIAGKGQMAEGRMSTFLGMKGIPVIGELLMVQRDIELAKYNNCRVHISKISCSESVDLIRKAKKEGIQVTADVAIINLVMSDESLESFDSNLKVLPPLRSQNDIDALIAGLKDGTIDAISSDHTPEDIENKVLEFDYAAFGAIQLQTLFSLALKTTLSLEEIIKCISINPRKVLELEIPSITKGEIANITIFNNDEEWLYNSESNKSKSSNSYFLGSTLKGKVKAIYNRGELVINR